MADEHTPSARLVDLPEELLTIILRSTDQRTRMNAARSCRKLVGPAQSLLYESFRIVASCGHAARRTLFLLVRTLAEQPALASMVCFIEVGDWYMTGAKRPDAKSLGTLISATAVLEGGPSQGLLERLHSGLIESSFDSFLTTLLALLPKLSTLSMQTSPAYVGKCCCKEDLASTGTSLADHPELPSHLQLSDEQLFVDLVANNLPPKSPGDNVLFTHITSVSLHGLLSYDFRDVANPSDYRDISTSWDFGLVMMCLRLPSLLSFYGSGCQSRNPASWPMDLHSSNVKSLTIGECDIGTADIKRLLDSCKSLDIFACELPCQFDRSFYNKIQFGEIAKSLTHHRHSLKKLAVEHPQCDCLTTCESGSLGSLVDYTQLRELSVKDDELMGTAESAQRSLASYLPKDLETLELEPSEPPLHSGMVDELAASFRDRTSLRKAMLQRFVIDTETVRQLSEKYPNIDCRRFGASLILTRKVEH